MLKLSCLCGRIRLETKELPDYINECNCTLCRKTGARWGYFHPSEVNIEGTADRYRREDKDKPVAEIHFCANCSATTHWTLISSTASEFSNTMMGVNMQLANERELNGIELRYPNGQAWSGEGDYGYVREAGIIG